MIDECVYDMLDVSSSLEEIYGYDVPSLVIHLGEGDFVADL